MDKYFKEKQKHIKKIDKARGKFDLMRDKVDSGYYSVDDYEIPSKMYKNDVVDEDKSVKWNREQVSLHNADRERRIEKRREYGNTLRVEFETDLKQIIKKTLKCNQKQANRILSEAQLLGASHLQGNILSCEKLTLFLLDLQYYEEHK